MSLQAGPVAEPRTKRTSPGTKSTSSVCKQAKWASLVSDVTAEWLEAPRQPRAISAVRGAIAVPPSGPHVPFESSLERDFLAFCRTDPAVARVRGQQMVLHFSELKTGKHRRYTPDFVVDLAEESVAPYRQVVVETKRWVDLVRSRAQMQAPLAAARLWASRQNDVAFEVVTDRRMAIGHWLANARLLSGQIDKPFDAEFEAECGGFLRSRGEFRISEILLAAQQRRLNPEAVLAVLHRMVVRGELYLDRGFAIGPQTWVSVVGAQE